MWPRRPQTACYSSPAFDALRRERAYNLMSVNAPSSALLHRPRSVPDHEQKQAALSYLNEAWAEARHDGVDGDCLAQASLFAALAELVCTYGEDPVAKFVEGLPARVHNGEFSLALACGKSFNELRHRVFAIGGDQFGQRREQARLRQAVAIEKRSSDALPPRLRSSLSAACFCSWSGSGSWGIEKDAGWRMKLIKTVCAIQGGARRTRTKL